MQIQDGNFQIKERLNRAKKFKTKELCQKHQSVLFFVGATTPRENEHKITALLFFLTVQL